MEELSEPGALVADDVMLLSLSLVLEVLLLSAARIAPPDPPWPPPCPP